MQALKGTKRLVRLALRRDRFTIPITMVLVIMMVAGSGPALAAAYPDYATQVSYVASSVPSIIGRLFQGTVNGVSLGTILVAETFMFTAVILAIMSIFIVTRHTRQNEESGAGELIGSGVVGRSAPLTAAIIVGVGANVLIGIILFGLLASTPEFDKTGSAYYSVALAMSGIFFVGVAAITSQLSDYKRGANALAIAVLGIAFFIRGVGDALGEVAADGLSVTTSWITWLSPLGWANQTLPYSENRIEPLALLVLGTLVACWSSYILMRNRDIGSSIFVSKAGNSRAKISLLGANGLTKKLQRGGLLGWGVAFFAFGSMMGIIVNDFRSTFEENETFQAFISASGSASSFSDMMFSAMFPISIAILSGYVVTAMSKMQDEELSGRIEYLLSTALGRFKWMMSHVGYAVFGISLCIMIFGLSAAIGYELSADVKESNFGDILLAAAINIPASIVFMSAVLFVYSFKGKLVKTFAWFYFAYIALIGSIAGIFEWPEWVSKASPFYHVPLYPSVNTDWMPLVWLSVVAGVLILVSFLNFKKRDLNLK